MRGLAAALLLALVLFPSARAQQATDVAIVLAVDASSSVNLEEFGLQMQGIAAALRDPQVLSTIAEGPSGSIAIALVQWSGPLQTRVAVPWRLVEGADSAEALAKEIEETPRYFYAGSTAIGRALVYSAAVFDKLPWSAGRRVIDISGDGSNTDNPPVGPARAEVLDRGIVINGLPILAQEPEVDRYYAEQVIGGHGAFIEVARDYNAFTAAMTRKLVREIRTQPLISRLEQDPRP
ncbi:MAG: DUF1194 domain-containing protein [Minwuia sp.]|uniref:DUF1194 domain-containing protein n=1 Tax=Minwuia sp. TaxID=2493630 RepID=UPI003A8BB9BB